MVGALYYYTKDQLGKDYREPVGDISLSVVEGDEDRVTNAQKIDTLVRAINNLSTNTFTAAYVDYSYNIDEILDEG